MSYTEEQADIKNAEIRSQLDKIKEYLAECATQFLFEEGNNEAVIKREQEALAHLLQGFVDSGAIQEFVVRPFKQQPNGEWTSECWLKFPPIVELEMTVQPTGVVFEDDTVSGL